MSGLYAITDSQLIAETQLYDKVETVLKHGCRWLQYRDKSSHSEKRQQHAKELLRLCQKHSAELIINDDIALAQQLGCGLHLGQNDGDIRQARARLGQQAIIGASCYNSLDKARHAVSAGASYVAFGAFYPSRTKPDAITANPNLLIQARNELNCPIVAIGGITPENGGPLIKAGADYLAVIASLWQSHDLAVQTQRFSQLFKLNK